MKLPLGYKQTEVGIIPNDWDVKTIDQIAFVTSGKRLPLGSSLVDAPTPHPYIRVTDLRPGTVDTSKIKYVPEAIFPKVKRFRIYRDDIFISVAGSLGIVGKIPEELDGANLTENADRITDIRCVQDYLLSVLMSPMIQAVIKSSHTVGAQPKLALARIRKFCIPLPATEAEQKAIAEAFSDVDGLLGALEALIAKKRVIKKAAMQQLLTGKTRLPGFSAEWDTVALDEVVTRTTGFWGAAIPSERADKPVGVIRAGDISEDGTLTGVANRYFSDAELVRAQCQVGDVVMTVSGNGLGKSWLFFGKANLAASNFVRLLRPSASPRRITAPFLSYTLKGSAAARLLVEHTATSAYPNLRSSFFSTRWLPLPPIDEQNVIAELLSDMDAEISALEARRDKTGAIKQSIMQQLLTGRVRLLKPTSADASA
jgi:type I restriction enzyme S subunit